jgi:hypothetical protein
MKDIPAKKLIIRLWVPPRLLNSGYRGRFLGVNRPVCEIDHSTLSSVEENIVELYLHFPICLHGIAVD